MQQDMQMFLHTLSVEKLEELQKFGKLQKLQNPESRGPENMESDSEYAPSVVHECCLPHTQQITGKLNASYIEWRKRLIKRWGAATSVETRDWFPISIALLLQANNVYIELSYRHKLATSANEVGWPTPGNRNVGKRGWEAQIGAARYHLRNASVYFTFWMSWVKGRVKGEAIEHLLSLSSRTSSNVTGCAVNGAVEAAWEDEEDDDKEEEDEEEEEEEEEEDEDNDRRGSWWDN
jgi:hypothetical protein